MVSLKGGVIGRKIHNGSGAPLELCLFEYVVLLRLVPNR